MEVPLKRSFAVIVVSLIYVSSIFAGSFVKEAVITVDKANQIEISGNPGLQTKKINTLKIETKGPSKIKVISFDATMPAHDHGMVVKASKPKKMDDGSFIIKGVKLHMPGDWEFEIKAEVNGTVSTLKQFYKLQP